MMDRLPAGLDGDTELSIRPAPKVSFYRGNGELVGIMQLG